MSSKAIILNGLERGGTNIAWNILQSHPNIISPMVEINELVGKRSSSKFADGLNKQLQRYAYFQNKFRTYALKNLEDEDNRYKTPETLYTEAEILKATICFKGVCSPTTWDLKHAGLINNCYEQVHFISLLRNGYAVCEGWRRRGVSAKKAGYYYSKFGEAIMELANKFEHHKIVYFENILAEPFEQSEAMFSFVGDAPVRLSALRLKVKATLNADGSHTTKFGTPNRKFWFTNANIQQILNPDINAIQANALSIEDQRAFEKEAKQTLDYFKYLI